MHNTITAIIIAIGIVGATFIASMSVNSWIRIQGVKACISGGRSETKIVQDAQTQTFIQPDGGWYKTCLKDMGLSEDKK